MVNTVQSTNCSLIASWMMLSVLQTGGEGRGEEGREGDQYRQNLWHPVPPELSSLDVHISSGLIQNKDLVASEQSPGQAHQLPLAHAEVGPSLSHLSLQPSLQLLHHCLQLDLWLARRRKVSGGVSWEVGQGLAVYGKHS